VARSLHDLSPRHGSPFVAVNCSAIPETLLESEIFGHEKGAFTGAVSAKPGLLEVANRGTVFLDEIGDMDEAIQPKLLKVLEEKRFRRVGEVRDRVVDVRLVAATNHDLAARVREGRFRSDLYFRVSTIPLRIPPLRERPEDVPLLAGWILDRLRAELARPGLTLSPAARAALQRHAWPGNLRELRNVLERAALLADSERLEPRDLRLEADAGTVNDPEWDRMTLAELERAHVRRVVEACGGQVDEAARRLGLSRSALYDRLRKYGLASAPADGGRRKPR
jgi:DNA-binding NtrC family response regulator